MCFQHELSSHRLLKGGASNLSYLLRFNQTDLKAVLRIYIRDPGACEKEIRVWRSAAGIVPVPEILHANPRGKRDLGPYIIYRFAEGVTFQTLKSAGNMDDTGTAAYAIGEALAKVQSIASLAVPCQISDDWLNSIVLEQRLGRYARDRVSAFISGWLPELKSLNEKHALVHGNFNSRNTIIKRKGHRWVVSGILDWEQAFSGSPLWDAARFICYESYTRPCREPHFSAGYVNGGGSLPADWARLARVINTLTAAESLGRPDLCPAFVPELCQLVAAFVDNRDPA